MMNIQLPPLSGGRSASVLRDVRLLTVIGANGSGKSRFCGEIIRQSGDKAFRMSALRAIFPASTKNTLAGSIDDRFDRMNDAHQHLKNDANTEFDKLTYILLSEEFRDLMNFKAHRLMGEEIAFPVTKLDKVVKGWQRVFPKNKVLRENGKLLFSTEGQPDSYSSLRLSDGEKAVLYYIGAALYAPDDGVIIVDDPEVFIHHSIMHNLWNMIEALRSDCTFIYNTHDVEFAASRVDNRCVWVKAFDPEKKEWDYEVMPSGDRLSDALYLGLLGSRKPVLFIEGDDTHSIDAKLYPMIFQDYTVKPLGSCNKVIESVRTFNSLTGFHHLNSWGIVDRDRRAEPEVDYLRRKKVLVPNVAEIENILMLEDVIRAVARQRHRKENSVFSTVRRRVMDMFKRELKEQALMHVRHRVKREVEVRIDAKFESITKLENHMIKLVEEINPHDIYNNICLEFHSYLSNNDYASVLRVFNQKLILSESGVAELMGLNDKESYIRTVLNILKSGNRNAKTIKDAILECFGLTDEPLPTDEREEYGYKDGYSESFSDDPTPDTPPQEEGAAQ